MIVEYIVGQMFLAIFNIINSRIDAYRILKHKTISHAINFTAYGVFVSVLCFLFRFPVINITLFCLSAFFNRQFSFDVPLNLRRGLTWYYQSQDNPPKALLDRIERALFGTGEQVGKKIFHFYLFCFLAVTNIWLVAWALKFIKE